MKKFCLFGVVVSTLLSSTLLAAPQDSRNMDNRPEMRNNENSKADAEAQKMLEETRQRRREILNKIQVYKSATEEEQATIKADVIKIISEDYALNIENRKQAIDKIELKVTELGSKADERAKNSVQLIEEEFEKLVSNNHRNSDRAMMQRGERGEMPEGDRPMMQRGERGEMPEGEAPEGDRPMMQRGERGDGQNMRGERGENSEGDRPMMQRGERGEMPEGEAPEGDRPMMQRGERGEGQNMRGEGQNMRGDGQNMRGDGMNELNIEEGLVELPTMNEDTIKENRERRSAIISKAAEYRNAPEEAKEALKAEVIKLLNDDFEINTKNRKEMISKTKENIAKVKNDIAEDEANAATVVEQEFEKLIKMDFSRRDRNQNGGRSQRR